MLRSVNALAYKEYPVVTEVTEDAANDRNPRGTPIERPHVLTLWDVFAALQDAAEEAGATEQEADRLVVASYYELSRSLVPG
jgi:hypothetical protein